MNQGYVFVPYIIAEKTEIIVTDCGNNYISFFKRYEIEKRRDKIEKIMKMINDRPRNI